nr:1,2-dihydroxy-3-keto-5-methylthiopentene dioxygenase 3-like isoform X2 [Setaria viridis]
MMIKRALLTKFLLLALLVLQTREVSADSRLESFVHDELQFSQGLGFPSIASFRGDFAEDMLNGVDDVVQAWYMDDATEEDQRLPHHRQPDDPVPLAKLLDLGIVAMRLDADNHDNDENLTMIRDQRGYLHMDIVTLTPEKMANYEAMIKRFFEEHLHADEEVRYCLEGSEDRWIRVSVRKGGLIVVPAGIYHRFTLDTNNYIKAMRLFSGGPDWTAYNRPHDHLPARKKYLAASHKRREEHRSEDQAQCDQKS